MMIGERNYRKSEFAFTASQWQELEQQVLTFKYIMSGLPVPPALISTVITTPSNLSSSSSLFPQHQHPQQLTIGLGCFQVGNGRKIDTEPGRCKRTDGKKWRCTKEAYPDSKYCEKHMHRSKSAKAKRLQQQQQLDINISATKLPFNTFTTTSSSANLRSSCSPYPAISYSNPVNYPSKFQANSNIDSNSVNYPSKYQPNSNSNSSTFYPFLSTQSPSSSNVSLSTQEDGSAGSHWLGLDGELHDDQHNRRDSRYCNQIEGAVSGKGISSSEASTVTSTSRHTMNMGYKIDKEDKEQRVGVDKEHDTQKLYHHFLGDWPMKLQSSHAIGVFPRR